MNYFLAIDIGASSGRHIIGYMDKGKLIQDEVYRFTDYLSFSNDHFTWDIKKIFDEVKKGIKKAFIKYLSVTSLSIDTWGCDYVLLDGDEEILPCYSYRDKRTADIINEVHSIIPFEKLYEITGSQYQPFNTIYQLYKDKIDKRLDKATDFLMIPEYLIYKLTGIKVKEYTNASTTGLTSLNTLDFSQKIISKLGFKKDLFKPLYKSGFKVGLLKEDIVKEVSGNTMVILSSTHDTASAVKGLGINMDEVYLSSGTWSLLGIKRNTPVNSHDALNANYSNEYGDNYIRFQKNIMGMWIVNNLGKELSLSPSEMVRLAKESSYKEIYDVNDKKFISTVDIMKDIYESLKERNKPLPNEKQDYISSTIHSLAYSYKEAIDELEKITNRTYDKIYIVGGGAKNTYLNELTELYTKKKVIALPIEGTAIGNLYSQMEAINENRCN